MQNIRDSLFLLYSHPISTVPEEILFLYESTLLHANSFLISRYIIPPNHKLDSKLTG
uniref:ORF56c n=1 Tax=Pinus thunbergii TaxID=3350 RepID=Q33003_PINTH|nr:ORF56c [Pinus thunbergii]BAA04455.1 ORF56c [Pinus thunbergii]